MSINSWMDKENMICLYNRMLLSPPPKKKSEYLLILGASQMMLGKEPVYQCRRNKRCGFDSWARENPQEGNWQLIPVFLPEESHRQRSLASTWMHLRICWGKQKTTTTKKLDNKNKEYMLLNSMYINSKFSQPGLTIHDPWNSRCSRWI